MQFLEPMKETSFSRKQKKKPNLMDNARFHFPIGEQVDMRSLVIF